MASKTFLFPWASVTRKHPKSFSMRRFLIVAVTVLIGIGLFKSLKFASERLFPPAAKTYPEKDKFPLKAEYFYQNNNYTFGIDALIDGNLNTNFLPGYQMLNDGPHVIVCLFPKEWDAVPKKIRVFDGGEGTPIRTPTRYFLVRRDNGKEVEIGKFDGMKYRQWQEFDVPEPFIADKLIIRGYQDNGNGSLGAGEFYGTELEIIGDHKEVPARKIVRTSAPLRQMFGTNAFWWDLTQDPKDATRPYGVYEPKMKRWKETGIDMFRFYMDWGNFEPEENKYAFQPTKIGWYTDELFDICKRNGIKPLMCIQTNPAYMWRTYADSNNAIDYAPVRSALKDQREKPASYADAAKFAFVIAARYGRNAAISDSLLGQPYDHNVWYVAKNKIRKGLGTLEYFEFGNELDKDWKGRYNYMDGYKIAALLSAVYDGDKKTMNIGFGAGRGVGIKNADPSMKLVVTGLARSSPDAYRAIWDWSRVHRGYRADGSVDLPFDVINYHQYSTDGGTMSQRAPITTAMPPELSGVLTTAADFVEFSNTLGQGKEVWVTEWGFDYHPESTYSAPLIGSYSREEVIGAWSLRTMLLYPSTGVDRLIWFKSFDDDSLNPQFFSTMSLLHFNDSVYTRRAVADYMAQLKPYGGYRFQRVISTQPYVVEYQDGAKKMWAIWSVESTSPVSESKFFNQQFTSVKTKAFTENKGSYELSIPNASKVVVKEFVTGSTEMSSKPGKLTNNKLRVSYGLRPIIIETVD